MRSWWAILGVLWGVLGCGGAQVRSEAAAPTAEQPVPASPGAETPQEPAAEEGSAAGVAQPSPDRQRMDQEARELAERLRGLRDPAEVRRQWTEWIQAGNESALAYGGLAVAEIRLGDYPVAAEHAWKAVEMTQGARWTLPAAREAFFRIQRSRELGDRLEALTRKEPENLDLRLALAWAWIDADRPAEALREATEVLRADETRVDAMIAIARAYLAMKRYEAAEYVALQSLELRKDPGALTLLGHVAWFRGDAARAMAFYRQAIEVDSGQPEVWNNLSALYQDAGDPAAAEKAATEALRLDPLYWQAWNNLGNARRAQGNLPGALAAFQEALRLHPDCAECEFNLGVAEMENRPPEKDEPGHWRRAIEHLSRYRVLRQGPPRADPVLEAYLEEARRNADSLEKEQERLRPAPGGTGGGSPDGLSQDAGRTGSGGEAPAPDPGTGSSDGTVP